MGRVTETPGKQDTPRFLELPPLVSAKKKLYDLAFRLSSLAHAAFSLAFSSFVKDIMS